MFEGFCELVKLKICELVGKTVDPCGDYFDRSTDLPNREMSHGVDTMIDDDRVFWWIETNRVSELNVAGPKEICDMTEMMLREMVDIELEVRKLKVKGKPIVGAVVPLASVHDWKPVALHYYGKERALNHEVLATLDEPPPIVPPPEYR